jgi:hypothetical protein
VEDAPKEVDFDPPAPPDVVEGPPLALVISSAAAPIENEELVA